MAAKPVFCTELSELNSRRSEFPSLVITGGRRDPQNKPCFLTSPEPILDESARLSYSQSCWKNKALLVIKSLLRCTQIQMYNDVMKTLTPMWVRSRKRLYKKRRWKKYVVHWSSFSRQAFLCYYEFTKKNILCFDFFICQALMWRELLLFISF